MRFLALVPPGTNARSIFSDMLRGVQRAGHEVYFEDIAAFVAGYQQRAGAGRAAEAAEAGTMYARHLESLARTLTCDAMVTLGVDGLMAMPWVTAGDGRQASFVEAIGLPVVHYWLDAPFWAYGGQLLPALDRSRFVGRYHVHVVNNEGTAEEMRRVLGFQTVIAQAYGVDEATFRPWVGLGRDYELAICAGPGDAAPTGVMREELEREEPDVERVRRSEGEAVMGALVDVLSVGGEVASARLLAGAWIAEQLADPDRPMVGKLEVAVGRAGDQTGAGAMATRLMTEPGGAGRWAKATALVRRVDSWQRAFYTAYLSRRFRSLLVGSGAAAMEQAGWPVKGDKTGFLGYHELAVCYGRAAAGVSVMRYQDDVGLNPKGLEIAASGTVSVQRRREGSGRQLDDGTEAVWFSSPAEARERVRGMLSDGGRREKMANAGRDRVLREHTWTVKAGEMVGKFGAALRTSGLAG